VTLPPADFSRVVQSRQTQEQDLIARIRRGDQVRDETVLFLQPTLRRMAKRMYQRHHLYSNAEQALEPADLAQAATLRLLEKFPRARFQVNPLAWLYSVAANAMRDLLNGRAALIKREPDRPPILVLALDAPLTEQGTTLTDLLTYDLLLPTSDTPPLFEIVAQAVAALPDNQRMVIERVYGLNSQAPTPLRQLSRELSPARACPSSAEYHYRRALAALRQSLSHVVSQHTTTGGTQ